jgi:2-succinyl-5-enolpyruvyl-6-hydroxy-3-cyclohexene-1-carboxylate synthase
VPETTAVTFCATLVDEWVRAGVTDAVVAPGSRSTPMVLALAADGRMRVHVHHDERSAGFVALGLGLATGRPAVVLTTSGTAAVELHPAVVEAHEAGVPMLVCTADRPPELHGVGAPQTIDQQRLFGSSVRLFVDAGVPEPDVATSWRSLAADAVVAATGSPPGPVHLNLAFRDPLVGDVATLPAGRPAGRRWHLPGVAASTPTIEHLDALAAGLAGRRGVIVAGGRIDDVAGVQALARATGWPVFADPRSGCRVPESYTISHVDAILRVSSIADSLRPDVVLRLGSLPASKVLAAWLAGLDAWQVGIDVDGTRYDPDRSLDGLIAAAPGRVCAALADRLADSEPPEPPAIGADVASSWAGAWAHADAVAAEAIAMTLAGHPEPTEPAIARDVVAALPEGATLVVSSSMPIRDVEWYSAPRPGLRVLANRGANGIDGVVSTAVGVAIASKEAAVGADWSGPTALLIGDVAFLYDINGLLGAARRGIDLTIVVVDNDGGGIFSFLPQADALASEPFELLYGAPHGVDLVGLAAAHGIGCRVVDHQVDLAGAVAGSAALGGVQVVLVRTDRAVNVAVHAELHAAVTAALTP